MKQGISRTTTIDQSAADSDLETIIGFDYHHVEIKVFNSLTTASERSNVNAKKIYIKFKLICYTIRIETFCNNKDKTTFFNNYLWCISLIV